MKSDEGRSIVRDLAARADVFVQGFRPGVADRLGIGYAELSELNASLVYCSITGYGQDGPYSMWAGHDLNWLGVGGYLALSGRSCGDLPAMPGAVVADASGGMCAALAILAALVRRGVSGAGSYLDLSVLESVLRLTYLAIDQHLAMGEPQQHDTGELLGGAPYYGVYRTADGRFVTVAAIEPKFFANLCRALDLSELAEHQRTPDRQADVRRAFTERLASRTRADWVRVLPPLDTCVAPVYEIDEIACDPHIKHRKLVWKARHEELGWVSQLVPALAGAPWSDEPAMLRDLRATDPEPILAEFGIDPARRHALRSSGVVS
jgi:alpha-methylacyl-CoA racemase